MTNEKEQFYEECAKILEVDHNFQVPYFAYKWPNRWNNRAPGNGRFEGRGCIMMYGPTCIHIMLHSPQKVNCRVSSPDEAYAILRSIMGNDTLSSVRVGRDDPLS